MDNETRARIEKEANSWVDYNSGGAFHLVPSQTESYIAGAVAEHSRITELLKEERNKVIDEVMTHLKDNHWGPFDHNGKILFSLLESLKGKQQ